MILNAELESPGVLVELIAVLGSTSVNVFIVDSIGPGGGSSGPASAAGEMSELMANASVVFNFIWTLLWLVYGHPIPY